jgi:hypothetical protein
MTMETANTEVALVLCSKAGVIESERKFVVTPHGLQFYGKLSESEFRELLRMLKALGESFDLCFGSALKAGFEWYGRERTEELLEQAEFPYAKAMRALVLAQMELRFDAWTGLTGDHFHVLGMAFRGHEDLQEKWAGLAEEHKLSPRALKRSIECGEVVTDEIIEEDSGKGTGGIGYLDELELAYRQWSHRIGGKSAVLKLEPELRRRWLDGVSPILELAREVEMSLSSEGTAGTTKEEVCDA